MYPYKLITFSDGTGITLYEIFILIGAIVALLLIRVLGDKRKMPAKLQNLILIGTVVSIVLGYLSAVLFQAVYNIASRGKFIIDEYTGATFYGGLIGGAICLIVIYLVGGKLMYRETNEHLRWFPTFANIAACCIPAAHAFGRIGCLMAGCCHGGFTDAWYGIEQYVEVSPGVMGWAKVVPVQLFEAIFLFVLAAAVIVLYLKNKPFEMPIYLIGYGVWRFIIEFYRTDDRGTSFIPGLSPSQTTAIFLVAGGIAIVALGLFLRKKYGKYIFLSPAGKQDAADRE